MVDQNQKPIGLNSNAEENSICIERQPFWALLSKYCLLYHMVHLLFEVNLHLLLRERQALNSLHNMLRQFCQLCQLSHIDCIFRLKNNFYIFLKICFLLYPQSYIFPTPPETQEI